MPSLPPTLAAVMVAFQPLFSKPVFERALVLVAGALLAVRVRTVTAALRVTGHTDGSFSAYHRVLSRARWSCRDAARMLLGLLVERFVPEGPVVVGLDDTLRAAADADPVGFVAELPPRTILDEVQRVPALFTSLKAAVDRDRTPGRFLLTGSANILFVPRLADSLAGRMETLRLHPLSRHELAARPEGTPTFVERLFAGDVAGGTGPRLGDTLAERVAEGGYPAALARASARRRAAWYRDYVDTLIQRDVCDLARIRSLETLPRLLSLVASQTARLINVADLAGPFQLTRPTIREYVTLLARVFLLDELPPWHSNRLCRLVKTAKLHAGDTGLACALLGLGAEAL